MSIKIKTLFEMGKNPIPEIGLIKSALNVFQYNPVLRYIESVRNELIFTSNSGIPLIRFNLHDSGQVFSFKEAENGIAEFRNSLKGKVKRGDEWQLPFVSLLGRSDYTIIFYAANIYPQNIHAALHKKDFFAKLTGKFTIRKYYTKKMDEMLEINVELRPNTKITSRLAHAIRIQTEKTLKEVNMEYKFLCEHLDKDLSPKIKLWPYQDQHYFKPGLKPKYIFK